MTQGVLQTVDRALALLELLASSPKGLRPAEIASRMELNKVAVHRQLVTLKRRGFVEQQKDGRYLVGLKLISISSARLNLLELKTEAQPLLRQLADQARQPVHLAIFDEGQVVYIEKLASLMSMRMYSEIGRRSPVHCTALGKVLLAGMSRVKASQVLDEVGLDPYTKNTITDKDRLLEELEQARRRGYALDNAEHEEGVFCLAAPIYDYRGQAIAAVSTAGSRNDFITDEKSALTGWLLEAAAAISARLGYSAPAAGQAAEQVWR